MTRGEIRRHARAIAQMRGFAPFNPTGQNYDERRRATRPMGTEVEGSIQPVDLVFRTRDERNWQPRRHGFD